MNQSLHAHHLQEEPSGRGRGQSLSQCQSLDLGRGRGQGCLLEVRLRRKD